MLRAIALFGIALSVLLAAASSASEVEGRVCTDSGVPVEEARVEAVCTGQVAHTDAAGAFRINAVTFPCRLSVSHPDLVPRELELAAPTSDALEISLESQQEPDDVVVVTANRWEEPPQPSMAATTSVSPRDSVVTPRNVTELVARIPGVMQSGQGGAFQTPTVRGIARQRLGTLVSGINVVTERRAGASLSFLDPTLIGSAEVIRGPESSLSGAGGLGGLLQIEPRRFEDWVLEGGYEIQGNQNYQSVGWGDGRWSVGAARRWAQDSEAPDGRELNDHFTQYSAVLSRGFWIGENEVDLLLIPSYAEDIGKSNNEFPVRITNYPRERHLLFQAASQGEAYRAHVYLHPNDLRTEVTRGGSVTDVESQSFDYGSAIELEHPIGDLLAEAGLDLFGRAGVDSTEKRRIPGEPTVMLETLEDGRQNDLGAHARLSYSLGPVTAQGGVRYARQWQSNGDSSGVSAGAFAGMGGLIVAVGEFLPAARNLELVASAGTGFRFPTLTERFFTGTTGRGGVIGNPELDHERSVEVDVGVRWLGEELSFEVFAFRNHVTDYIEQVDIAPGISTFVNLTEGTIRGIEVGASYEVLPQLLLWASGHVVHGRSGDGEPLADIPPARVLVGAEARISRALLALGAEYRFPDRDPGPGEVDIGRAMLLSARLGWNLGWDFVRGVSVWLYGSNLLDEAYRPSADEKSALAPGRSFGAGIRWVHQP